jgi:hypothetical protein
MRRWNKPAMRAYRNGILWDVDPGVSRLELALDLNRTVSSNIEFFLRDKTDTMAIDIETARQVFPEFWKRIGADGDLEAALEELTVHHHAGTDRRPTPRAAVSRGWRSWLPWRLRRRR